MCGLGEETKPLFFTQTEIHYSSMCVQRRLSGLILFMPYLGNSRCVAAITV